MRFGEPGKLGWYIEIEQERLATPFVGMSWANESIRHQNFTNVVGGGSKQKSVCICLVKQVTLVQLLTKVDCCVVNEPQMREQSWRWVSLCEDGKRVIGERVEDK